ncbi:HET-domain-containing protein, partial [Cadophora sp. DSE1049]
LQKCISSHPKCRVNTTKLPTRLLELSKPNPGHVRLRDTQDLPQSTSYVTLSHCWGDAKFFKLTGASHEQLSNGVPVSLLANTFQDAVHVAEKLSASYIWVDSLCIIQDSLQDWRQESVTMCDVYKGSLCNIAAAASSSSSEGGCFRERDPQLIRPCLVATKFTNRANDDFLLESQTEQWLPHDQQQPLYRRAWVVPERFLAPRVLNFGSQYLFWECRTCKASEIYPGGISAVLGDLSPLSGINADISGHADMYSATYHWNQIVMEYSKCALTKGSDKLVAISGIAREFKVLGDPGDYLAGMWRNTVMPQMLWRTANLPGVDFPKQIRNGQYYAPSWSWASV